MSCGIGFRQNSKIIDASSKVFAAVNWLNWIFIVASAIAYGVGIAMVENRANLLLGTLGLATLFVALSLLPGIFKLIREAKPSFVFEKSTD